MIRRPAPVFACLRVALSLLLFSTAGGCYAVSHMNPFARSAQGPQSIRIMVQNHNFADVRIYAETIRGEQLLGVVGGNTSEGFTMDWTRLDEIALTMQFLAGETYRTNPINVSPGDRLELSIEQNPRNAVLRKR